MVEIMDLDHIVFPIILLVLVALLLLACLAVFLVIVVVNKQTFISEVLELIHFNYMKKIIFFILSLPLIVFTQVPQGVGYQGVATDGNGIELVNQSISIRASIISASPTGIIEWQEIHNTSTDTFGLFNLTIGQGISTGNGAQISFPDITWGANTHFLKIEMDVNGGTNYSHMGTNQMMSVPYALYAESSGDGGDSDSQNEIQSLSFDGDTLSLSNGGGEVVFEQIVGTDSTMVADMISTAQSNSEIWIECVDMGIAQLCATLGLDSDATLGPDDNGYRYKLGCSNASSDNYISDPHWRKFKIHGLKNGFIDSDIPKELEKKYKMDVNSLTKIFKNF